MRTDIEPGGVESGGAGGEIGPTRHHAEVKLVIRDLKDQALSHFPSGRFAANSAWTVIACLAHNLQRTKVAY